MASRRKARKFALQLLFQEDVAGTPIEEIADFWGGHKTDLETRQFTEKLFRIYLENREKVGIGEPGAVHVTHVVEGLAICACIRIFAGRPQHIAVGNHVQRQ